jgi:conjugative transfer signal peptidase TraF
MEATMQTATMKQAGPRSSKPARKRRPVLLATAITFISTIGFAGIAGVRWNPTASIRTGLYVITNDANAPLVAFCPTGDAATEAIARGYRPRGLQCPDKYAALLKPVAARAGDTVEVGQMGISVNGKLLPNTAAFKIDAKKRPMHVWPNGTYIVQPGTVWVLSTYNKYSYDSRYYGPIQLSTVITHAKPFWTSSH